MTHTCPNCKTEHPADLHPFAPNNVRWYALLCGVCGALFEIDDNGNIKPMPLDRELALRVSQPNTFSVIEHIRKKVRDKAQQN